MVKKAVIPLLPFCYFFFKLKRQKGRVGWLTTRGRSRSCSIWIKLDTRHRNSQQFQLSIVLLRLAHFHLKNLPQKTPKKIEFKRKKKWENLIQPPSLSSFWLTRFPPLGQIVVQWSSSELPHQEKPPIVTAEVPIFNYCLWLYHACYFAQLTNPSSSSTSLPSFGSLCWIRVRVGLDSLSCSSFFFPAISWIMSNLSYPSFCPDGFSGELNFLLPFLWWGFSSQSWCRIRAGNGWGLLRRDAEAEEGEGCSLQFGTELS